MVNDYELIYLIQYERDECALKYLINKYKKYIYKTIYYSDAHKQDMDDFYQEALVLLMHIVNHFDESKNKTFTKYFELVLKRHLQRLIYKSKKYVLKEDLAGILAHDYTIDDETIPKALDMSIHARLNEVEQICFKLFYKNQVKPKEIAKLLDLDIKKVYNMLYQIKHKIKTKTSYL